MKNGGALAVELWWAATGRRRSGPRNPWRSTFAHILCWSSRSPAASFLCAIAFAASLQLFAVLRFCAAVFRDTRLLQLYTPSICQPLNVRMACSRMLCLRQLRRAPLRWPAPGSFLTRLDRARRRLARMWCVPMLLSPPVRAYTMVWLGVVSCLKPRGAGGVCAGLPCSRRP